ncbi:hypothetical protein B0T19DRAFT_105137 [Cercophora scortea]|uniref:NCT transcriptional regulatory complex subunit A n=2 Tax=Sordariales TaxID=5139 RepID=A0AAE0IXU3_9PEZI|nr:hypothetical protein B0T19DRAFT_105137 [Cercophora scortea]
MSGDGSYAPRSPDLSSFYSTGPTYPQPQQRPLSQQSQSQFSSQPLHLQPSSATYFSGPPAANLYQLHADQLQHQHHLPTSPQSIAQNLPAHALGAGYSPRSHPQQQPYYPPLDSTRAPASEQAQAGPVYSLQAPPLHQPLYQPYGAQQYSDSGYQRPPQQQQQQHLEQQVHQQHQQQQQFLLQAQTAQSVQAPPPARAQLQEIAQSQFYGHSVPAPQAQRPPKSESHSPSGANTMPPRRAAAQAAQAPVIEPSPVKTKFPTARIKRIMQADEEVGKVAQQTPIAVGKALEMFMVNLVTKSADVAREKNSKRVSAQMLKQVVESDDQWDFLREIVSRVENEEKAAKSGGRAKAESESEEEEVVEKKKRAGRKKKA